MSMIEVSAVLLIDGDGRLLTVRKRGTERFMLPGGKPERGESPAACAVRECREEVGAELVAADLVQLGSFEADAANEPGHRVTAQVFSAPAPDGLAASNEIEELRWLDRHAALPDDLAPMLRDAVLPALDGSVRSMDDSRTDPPLTGSERDTLLGFLQYQRETLLAKTSELQAQQLTQRLEPSQMTLGGLLKHLAYVEDWWLVHVFAGEQSAPPWDTVDWTADKDWDWHSAAHDSPESLRELLIGAQRRSDEVVAKASSLDDVAAMKKDGARSLRWILVHLIEEYARHNGHADLLRESIDGAVGE